MRLAIEAASGKEKSLLSDLEEKSKTISAIEQEKSSIVRKGFLKCWNIIYGGREAGRGGGTVGTYITHGVGGRLVFIIKLYTTTLI